MSASDAPPAWHGRRLDKPSACQASPVTTSGRASVGAPHRVIERLLADPPMVHELEGPGSELGVWSTEASCYTFLAGRCRAGSATLETGLGLSTALFASLGTHHICVTPSSGEVDRLRAYCDERGIPLEGVRFVTGPSSEVLPRLDASDLDVVLLDGGHGFPTAVLDWYYACVRLRRGGVVVLDDRRLPAVAALVRFLRRHPSWKALEATPKWIAFERVDDRPLEQDFWEQPWNDNWLLRWWAVRRRIISRFPGITGRLRRPYWWLRSRLAR